MSAKPRGGKSIDLSKRIGTKKVLCPTHKSAMIYRPDELLWRCVTIGCKMTKRPPLKGLGETRPVIMRGPVELVEYEGRMFLLFVDSVVMVPVNELNEFTANVQDGVAHITLSADYRPIGE